jgi:hypothetical protein
MESGLMHQAILFQQKLSGDHSFHSSVIKNFFWQIQLVHLQALFLQGFQKIQ